MNRYLLPRIIGAGLLAVACAACRTGSAPETTTATNADTLAPTRPNAELRNTRWVLRQLGTQPVNADSTFGELYLLLRTDEPQAEGNAGCNRFRGSFEQPTPGELRLDRLLTTRRACPQLGQETQYLAALEKARRYTISADTLRLFASDADRQPLARFEAVYLR